MVNFGNSERYILSLFSTGEHFFYNNQVYKVVLSGKPRTRKGEPKTDIFVRSENLNDSSLIDFKISFKQRNADFLENKMTSDRAIQIFGPNWQQVITNFTRSIKDKFYEKPLIYKVGHGRTSKGSITLGWRFELINKIGGGLSGIANLTQNEVYEVYAGEKLDKTKRHAFVNDVPITNSGIANCIINSDIDSITNIQDAVDALVDLYDFATYNPNVYFVCKALNYRSFEKKIEGNRALSVYIRWEAENNQLKPYLEFDNPLSIKGKQVKEKLEDTLQELNINTTDDITPNNVNEWSIVKK
ncbi:hypothetical protein [Chryseomicrobium excrementi]|uniref:hypothetical protein n=1 Tax=Chryseomicrobium excrementi TaxID=2041346 RepID=UPI001FEC86E4|nr:hypothetical protein [Chryseomicrobium excrementi]